MNRGLFLSDEALLKLFNIQALQNISRKWMMPIADWKAALDHFDYPALERMPQH